MAKQQKIAKDEELTSAMLDELDDAELALVLNKIDDQNKEDAKQARYLPLMYGFDPAKEGMLGYSRIPNIIFEIQSQFLSVNLQTRKSVLDKNGNKKWTIKPAVNKGSIREDLLDPQGNPTRQYLKSANAKVAEPKPASLEPLDIQLLMYALTLVQRTVSYDISFSQKALAASFGKSETTIHRTVNKLIELGYWTKHDERIGVSGGHVRRFNVRPFMLELRRLALQHRKKIVLKEKEQRSQPSPF